VCYVEKKKKKKFLAEKRGKFTIVEFEFSHNFSNSKNDDDSSANWHSSIMGQLLNASKHFTISFSAFQLFFRTMSLELSR
jgi:hypothetical protein